MSKKKWKINGRRRLRTTEEKLIGSLKDPKTGIRDHLTYLTRLKKELKNYKPYRKGKKK
jgi:hypothetical protein|tara:strand:- start:6655 stop:6831 length:177 start_codon:yes stop_codon:yes gene_type:complete